MDIFDYKIFDEARKKQTKCFERMSRTTQVVQELYTCKKCKSTRIKTTCKQTRSSDEGTSVFAVCLDCNNQWRG